MSTNGILETMEEDFVDAAGELIQFLKERGKPNEAVAVFAMAAYVKETSSKMDQVLQELAGAKEQIKEMQQKQDSFSNDLLQTVGQMQNRYYGMKEQLAEIKTELKDKAVEIVLEMKQKGKEWLNGVADFLKIGQKLIKLRQKTRESLVKVN